MSEQTRLSDGDLREFRERLEEDRRAGLALWRVSTHVSPIDVIDETLARGVEREEADAGWAAAMEVIDMIQEIDGWQLAANVQQAIRDLPSLPALIERIRAMEKVVENAREYFRTRDFGLTPEESDSPNHFELANRLGEMNFQAEMNARKSLSDLDAIEKRIGGKEEPR